MSEKTPDFCTAILEKLQLETVKFEQDLFMYSTETGRLSKTKEDNCDFLVMKEPETDTKTFLPYKKKIFTFTVPTHDAMTSCPIWTDKVDNMIYYFLKNLMKFDISKVHTDNSDRSNYILLFLQNLIHRDELELNLLPDVFFFHATPKIKDNHFFLNTFAKIFFTVFITIILFDINLRTYLFDNSNEIEESKKTFYKNILDELHSITDQKTPILWNNHYKRYLTIYKNITREKTFAEIFNNSIDIETDSFSPLILLNENLISIVRINNHRCRVKIHMDINKENLKTMIRSLSSQTKSYLKKVPIPVSDEPSAEQVSVHEEQYDASITFDQFLESWELYRGRNITKKNSETESLTKVTKFLEDHLGIRNVSTSPVYRKFKLNIYEKKFQNAVFNFFEFWFLENIKKKGEYFLDKFYNDWSYVRNSILFLIELIQKSKNFEDSKKIFKDKKFSYILTEMGNPERIEELKSFLESYIIEPEHKEVKCKWSFSYVSQPFIQTQEVKPQLHFFLFIAKCLNHNPLQHLSGFEYIPTETI